MEISKSDYTYGLKDGILFIEDLNLGRKSVTNNMENVLGEIKNKIGNQIHDLEIIYMDSDNIWDGVKAEWTIGGCAEVDFYAIGEIKLEKAIRKIKRKIKLAKI